MGLIVALWKTDVLKTSIIVLRTSKKIAILGLSSRQNKMAAARALCAPLALPLWLLFVFFLDSFLVAEQQTVSMLDKYTSYGKDTTRAIQFPFPPSCPLHGLRFQLHGGRRTFLQGRLPCNGSTALWYGRCSTVSSDHHVWGYSSKPTTLVTRVGNFILYAFCPSPPLCHVDKTLWSSASLH